MANFLSYVEIKRVVYPYLKQISCQCQMCVFNSSSSKRQFARLVAAHTAKYEKQTSIKTVTLFPKWNTNIKTPVTVLIMRSATSLLYFLVIQANQQKYTSRPYAKKRHPFASYPAAKHTKHSKFATTDMREKPVDFFYCMTRASILASTIILLTRLLCNNFYSCRIYQSLM